MAEAQAQEVIDPLEVAVEQAIAVCDGDVRAALRASLIYNEFLERKLDMMRGSISSGYTRQRITPARKAAEKVEEWRECSASSHSPVEGTDEGTS